MSFYTEGDRVVRQMVRKEMLRVMDEELKPLYHDAGQRHAAARVMVDRALAKERANESSNPQFPA